MIVIFKPIIYVTNTLNILEVHLALKKHKNIYSINLSINKVNLL